MDMEKLAGATVIVAQPGDSLTFVTVHGTDAFDFEETLAILRDWFPDMKIGIVAMVNEVIHAKPEPQ